MNSIGNRHSLFNKCINFVSTIERTDFDSFTLIDDFIIIINNAFAQMSWNVTINI